MLDREDIDSYVLIIEAVDEGSPSLTGSGTVTVEVLDINDNFPQFIGSADATIIENPIAGSLVSTNLTATDLDTGSNAELAWSIMSGNVFDTFQIDRITGSLTVQNGSGLDYESITTYFLHLVVEDGGEPQRASEYLVCFIILC